MGLGAIVISVAFFALILGVALGEGGDASTTIIGPVITGLIPLGAAALGAFVGGWFVLRSGEIERKESQLQAGRAVKMELLHNRNRAMNIFSDDERDTDWSREVFFRFLPEMTRLVGGPELLTIYEAYSVLPYFEGLRKYVIDEHNGVVDETNNIAISHHVRYIEQAIDLLSPLIGWYGDKSPERDW